MEEKSPQKKAWETRMSKAPGQKAATTKKIKKVAKIIAEKIKNRQWEPEKVEYLKALKECETPGTCVVCGDRREYVLQEHHADRDRTIKVILCANCHDTIRRTDLDELKKARKSE